MPNNNIDSLMSSSRIMANISKPLFDYLGVQNFGYLKIYLKSYKYYYNTTDEALLLDYLNIVKNTCIFVKDAYAEHIHGQTFYFLTWPNQPNHYSMELYIKYLYWNGYTILTYDNEIIEMWWFTPNVNNTSFASFCHKNRLNLVKFIKHFQLRFEHLVPQDMQYLPSFLSSSSNFVLPELKQIDSINDDIFQRIFNEMPQCKKYTLPLLHNKISISKKEIECLKRLALGLTKKQVANDLNLSTRTIEAHYNNLKQKTQLYLKTDLINMYNRYLKDFL